MTSQTRTRVAGAAALVATAALGAGGAASDPHGIWLAASLVAGLCATLAAVSLVAGGSSLDTARGLLAVAPIVLLASVVAPLRLLTGAPLLALAGAALAALVVAARPAWARLALAPAVAILYLGLAWNAQHRVGPRGDEPHYLMVADSLLRDRDLSLERDYAEGRYRAFHPGSLEPHYRVRGKNGEIYSVHAVGLSVLILPAYALAGYPGVSLFMALLAVLLVTEIRRLARLVVSEELATGIAWLVALTPPIVHYVGLVFTEIPAAVVAAFALRAFGGKSLSARRWCAVAACLAFLPWMHVRYGAVAAILAMLGILRHPSIRGLLALASIAGASLLALLAYHRVLYGFSNPAWVWGRRPELSIGLLRDGLPGLLFDQEFGLLPYAPYFALAVGGVAALRRKDRVLALSAAALVVAVAFLAGAWPMWRGGFNPPARFLVPVVPALAVLVAARLASGWGGGIALLIGWSLWTGLGGAAHPELIHRDRDGVAPFFRAQSGAMEWTSVLPRYVLGEGDRTPLAAVWGVAIALASVGRGTPSPRALARGIVGLAVAGAVAHNVSTTPSEPRDAVRTLGKPALLVGSPLVVTRRAQARWSPLKTGALYEPFRYLTGMLVADRLDLAPGDYELVLLAEQVGSPIASATLLVHRHGDERVEASPLVASGARLTGHFSVFPGSSVVNLSIAGGSAMVLGGFELKPQP